ncbi:MAG: DUF447 family protein [Methanosarcinales archaeon]|nr:DUF447 family protein [Methanosarcinales archaeon]
MTKTGSENMDSPDPTDFGILDGISEVIATTKSDSGIPNAAPIGIIRNRDRLCVQLFPGSHTRQNAARTGQIVANIIHDLVMYVECTFGDPGPEAFEYPGGMDYPVLKRTSAWILFECIQSKGNRFELTPVRGMIRDKPMLCINRGKNAVIEALVHATRYRLNGDAQYLDLIRHYDKIVQRCGGSSEKEAIARLKEIMETQ